VKTTAQQTEVANLLNINKDLRIARKDFPITGAGCTWEVLTNRIIRNEARIKELAEQGRWTTAAFSSKR
jgi:hypothetical protein